jgi:hypothetical protein
MAAAARPPMETPTHFDDVVGTVASEALYSCSSCACCDGTMLERTR